MLPSSLCLGPTVSMARRRLPPPSPLPPPRLHRPLPPPPPPPPHSLLLRPPTRSTTGSLGSAERTARVTRWRCPQRRSERHIGGTRRTRNTRNTRMTGNQCRCVAEYTGASMAKKEKKKNRVWYDRCEAISPCRTRRTRRKTSRGRLRGTGRKGAGRATHAACVAPRQRQRQEAIVLLSSKMVELS